MCAGSAGMGATAEMGDRDPGPLVTIVHAGRGIIRQAGNSIVMKSRNLGLMVTLAVIAVLHLFPAPASAAGLTLNQGSFISLGSGQLDLDCGNLNVAGELNLGTGGVENIGTVTIAASGIVNGDKGSIDFGKDWNSEGVFNAGTSLVSLVDECGDGTSSFKNDNSLYDLSMVTSTGKNVVLEAERHQNVLNNLVLTGTEGNLLTLRSSIAGTFGIIELAESGSQFINYVDVKDNWAIRPGQHLALGWPQEFNSVDSGNNIRWFHNFEDSELVSSLSVLGRLLLIASMLIIAAIIYKRKFASQTKG